MVNRIMNIIKFSKVSPKFVHGNVRNVSTPDLIRLCDLHIPQQIRIRLVLRVWLTGLWLLVDCHQSHFTHKPTHSTTANQIPIISQDVAHLA